MTGPTTLPVPSNSPLDLLFNAEKLDEAVNTGSLTYPDRFGFQRKTLAGAMASISAINVRGAWVTGTVYAPRDVVTNSGTWYISLTNHTSGATFAGDLAANWRVYQGVVSAELAAATGALMVGRKRAAAPSAGTVDGKLLETISVDEMGAVPNSTGAAAANATAFAAAFADASTSTKHVIAATGGIYYLPTGTTLGAAGVTFDGRGATLKQSSGSQTGNWLSITGTDGFKLRNLIIDGNRAGAASLNADSSLLSVYDVEDVGIENVTVRASSAKGLSITSGTTGGGTRRIRVDGLIAYDCAKQAVMTDRSNGGTENPACEDILLDHIYVLDTDHAGVAINDGSRRVKLSNSVIDVNNTVWDAVSIRGSRGVTVSKVTGRRGRNGCQISVIDAAAIARGEEARDIILQGNHWEENDQNGCLIAGGINVMVNGDIALNNGQGVAAAGFNVSQVAGVRRSSLITLLGVSATDDQASHTQNDGITVAASDTVRVIGAKISGNVATNRVKLFAGVTDVEEIGNKDGATQKRVSGSTGSVPANSDVVVTLTFTTPFDITPNWHNASVLFGSTTRYLRVQKVTALTQSVIQVQVVNDHATLAATGTLCAEVALLN